jgi:negative regulator of sigma-B (phosphoserine phosphatase)
MKTAVFEYGVALLTLPGETHSGDKHAIQEFDGGALVALVDALGHGDGAADVADVAVKMLEQHANESLGSLLTRCHMAMRGTRGGTISMASFNFREQTMTWLGIGNVTGVVMYADSRVTPRVQSLLVRGGLVGDYLPALYPSSIRLSRGDTLILTTDGIRDQFIELLPSTLEPQLLAERILRGYAKHSDDATVVVFRFNGDQ